MKRVSLPGAEELFRSTSISEMREQEKPSRVATAEPRQRESRLNVPKTGSGRQQHEEKVTFYCTRDELLALERGRLALREFGHGADRGRIIREALSYVLADLEANAAASIIAERLGRDRR
jgi:hypothetical protein